jgi:hypothetical protein
MGEIKEPRRCSVWRTLKPLNQGKCIKETGNLHSGCFSKCKTGYRLRFSEAAQILSICSLSKFYIYQVRQNLLDATRKQKVLSSLESKLVKCYSCTFAPFLKAGKICTVFDKILLLVLFQERFPVVAFCAASGSLTASVLDASTPPSVAQTQTRSRAGRIAEHKSPLMRNLYISISYLIYST